MQIFYTENITLNKAIIDGQEHQHLAKVLRKKIGDKVYLCNGKGSLFSAEIEALTKKQSVLHIIEEIENLNENPCKLTLAVAPTKNNDRYEWMIEKATEIGVAQIIPFIAQNSERRKIKLERFNAKALAAMKQSKTLFLPKIDEAVKYKELLKIEGYDKKYIAYLRHNTAAINEAFLNVNANENILVLIGPEGGFTEEEVQEAEKNNFTTLSLGNKRLRTETAGVFTASAYQILVK